MSNVESEQVKEVQYHVVGLKTKQSALDVEFYVFTMDGKTIAKQVGVRRMTWHRGRFKTEGFQRALDMTRVREIANYLSNNPPIMPNAFVIAFESGAIEFTPFPNQKGQTQLGQLVIRGKLLEENGSMKALPESQRIGYVIDGQHRLRGIEDSSVEEGTFPVVVAAFHSVDTKFQLSQFYALNQTVPISPSLLALLRKELGIELRGKEAHQRAVALVCDTLMQKPHSPFEPEKYIGSAIYKGPLNVTVVQRMIDRAVKNTNLKYKWRANANEIPPIDLEYIAQALYVFWKAMSEIYAPYWGKNPKDQRLFSAIGLYTMVQFYDKVMENIDINAASAVEQVKERIKPIADLPWNKMLGLSSTPKSVFPELLFDAVNQLWEANEI